MNGIPEKPAVMPVFTPDRVASINRVYEKALAAIGGDAAHGDRRAARQGTSWTWLGAVNSTRIGCACARSLADERAMHRRAGQPVDNGHGRHQKIRP